MIFSGMTITTNDHYKSSDDSSIAVMMRIKVGAIILITMGAVWMTVAAVIRVMVSI